MTIDIKIDSVDSNSTEEDEIVAKVLNLILENQSQLSIFSRTLTINKIETYLNGGGFAT